MTIDCSFDWSRIVSTVGPCLRPGGPALTRRALKVCALAPDSCLADIGCGTGGTLKFLQRAGFYNLAGIDSSRTLLEQARNSLKSAQFTQGNAEELPLKTHAFDALFCECVLSILSNRVSALNEFARALRNNGFLIISDVFRQENPDQREKPAESEKVMANGLQRKEEIIGLLAELGFSLVLWEEHEKSLKEFAARMILAGERIPSPWICNKGKGMNKGPIPISYFLLVARKEGNVTIR
jgi:arsenite methyltransferase